MDKMIITQTFTMARWQIVVRKSGASKQTKPQLVVQGTTLFSVNRALELCDS